MTTARKTPRKSAARKPAVGTHAAPPPAPPEPERMARLFGLRTILGRPVYLTRSDWLEHIPFAFWLMEAQKPRVFAELSAPCGASYFAFCQAAERLELDTACFSVRDWPETDEGAAGLARLERHNAAHYSAFSQVMRGRYDEAPRYFEAGSVDLLHIDGLPGFHEARGAFEAWRPALSDRAVVVLHDSNVRGSGHGVARLVETLRRDHPVFAFKHGKGLAVVGVGSEQNEAFQRLFEAEADPAARSAIHTIFGRLGRACADSFDAREYHDLYRQSRADAVRIQAALDAAIAAAPEEPVALPRNGAETALLAPPDAEAAPADAGPKPDEAATLRAEIETLRAALDAARTGSGEGGADDELRRLQAGLQERFEEIAALTRSIYDLEEEKRALQDSVDAAARRAAAARDEADTARRAVEEKDRVIDELRQTLAQEAGQKAEFEHAVNALRSSTSWRVTAPVRGLMNAVRRGR